MLLCEYPNSPSEVIAYNVSLPYWYQKNSKNSCKTMFNNSNDSKRYDFEKQSYFSLFKQINKKYFDLLFKELPILINSCWFINRRRQYT